MKPINVLYAPINGIGNGGLSTIAFKLGTNMEKDKVNIDFFATYKINDNSYHKIASEKNGRIYDFYINEKLNPIFKKILVMKNFYKILKKSNYDIIHLHIDSAYGGFLFGCIAKIATKSKIVLHSHNSSISGKLKKILHYIFKPTLIIIGDEFATCSTKAANWMFPKYVLKNKKIEMIENGIDIDSYLFNEEIRKKYRQEFDVENNFVIGHIGRFSTQKNHDFLIDIFNEIYKRKKNAKLILVGIGELETKIKEKVKKLNFEENVIFLGLRDDVNNLLQAFDAFVLPSLYEGLPIVAVEAQAASLNLFLSDTITKEAKILPNVYFISLNQDAVQWAKEIIESENKNDRNYYKEKILESDFNIKKSALKLQKFYFKIVLGE